MRYLKTYKLFESSDYKTIENSDITEDIKDILLDAHDLGYTVEIKPTTYFKTSLMDKVNFHEISIRFYKKGRVFNTNDLKETDQRLLNYFDEHLIGSYYNDLMPDGVFRLSPNPDGPEGHRFPENLETRVLSMKYTVDKYIEIK